MKKFEKINVKIKNKNPLFSDSKQIPDNCEVCFLNLTGNTYVSGTKSFKYVACSFKADGIKLGEAQALT